MLLEAVRASIEADQQSAADRGVVALALAYAERIDGGDEDTLRELGPKLLAALESLQLSPRARALARIHAMPTTGGASSAAGPSRLDELRARRDGKRDAPPLDAPAP